MERNQRKVFTGEVVSDKMDKTITVAVVKREKVMFEIGGVSEETAREAFRLASHKLPVKTKFVKKTVAEEIKEEGGEG